MSATDLAPVTSLSEFIERVEKVRCALIPEKELWFRGESTKYRSAAVDTFLRPELYRPKYKDGRYLPLKPLDELLEIESQLYDDFKHGAVQLSSEKSEDDYWDWDSYFLMQHHSAPTRLLDWSDGALIALYFAIHVKTDDESENVIVYALDPDKLKKLPMSGQTRAKWRAFVKMHPSEGYSEFDWDHPYLPHDKKSRRTRGMPFLPDDPLVMEFPHITRRVAAQRSRFIVFGRNLKWLSSRLGKPKFPIMEIIVDSYSKKKIKKQLRDNGITESVIYPDLDGLGREVRQEWEDRR